jgi:hypothetical protein
MDLGGIYDTMEKQSLSSRITEQINKVFDLLRETNADRRTVEQTSRQMKIMVQDIINSNVERVKGNFQAADNYDKNWVGALVDTAKLLIAIHTGAITKIGEDAAKTFGKTAGKMLLNQITRGPKAQPISAISLQQEVGSLIGNLIGEGELSRTLGRVFGGIADGFNQLFTGQTKAEKYLQNRMDFFRGLQAEWNGLIDRRTQELLATASTAGYYANTSFENYLRAKGQQGKLEGLSEFDKNYYSQYLAGQTMESQPLAQNIPTAGFGIAKLGNTTME